MSCVALTRRGDHCNYRTRPDAAYCDNHDPANAENLAKTNSAKARRPRPSRTTPSLNLIESAFSLTDRRSIQAVLDTVIRLQLCGRIPDETAKIILRACAIATRNFDATRDTLSGPLPQQHEWRPYFERVQGLLHSVDPLLDEAQEKSNPPPEDVTGD